VLRTPHTPLKQAMYRAMNVLSTLHLVPPLQHFPGLTSTGEPS
jgi:hypothetical protein